MTATWPATLSQYVLRDSYQEEPYWPRYSFQADDGPPIEIPASTVNLSRMQCAMPATGAQLAILEAFVFTTLGKGSLPFDGPHPRTHATALLKFIDNPAPYKIRNVRGDKWTVTFALMALSGSA